jgi:rod shape-determining protein MreD
VRRFVSPRLLTLAFLLLALQYGLSPFFELLIGRIDFLYLLVLDYAFFWSWERVPFFALTVGLLRDFVGGHLFGIETVSLTLTGLLLYLGAQKLERESPLIRLAMTFLFVLLTESLSLGLGNSLTASRNGSWNLIAGVFLTTLYTTAVSPGFFWLTHRWFKRIPTLKQYELFK